MIFGYCHITVVEDIGDTAIIFKEKLQVQYGLSVKILFFNEFVNPIINQDSSSTKAKLTLGDSL